MDKYDQPDAVEQRVRFFDGQYLQDQDFIDEQKYHLDRERRLSRTLRITGVVEGLDVAPGSANQVVVAPGTAIDSLGRLLVLSRDLTAQERSVDLPDAKFKGQAGVRLYIVFQQTPTELATTGILSERRWLERPGLVAIAADGQSSGIAWDANTPAVLLAQLSLDGSGRVAVVANSAQVAGLSVKGQLQVDGNVGIGTSDPGSDKLSVKGGDTYLSGKLTVDGGSILAGNVGIGTSSPASRLHIFGGGPGGEPSWALSAKGVYGSQLRVDNTGDAGLVLGTPVASSAYIYHLTPLDGASAGIKFDGAAQSLSLFTANGNERLRIDNAGNVGIGTPSPQRKLHVSGGSPRKLVDGYYPGLELRVDNDGDASLVLSTPTGDGQHPHAAYIYHVTPLDGASAGIKFNANPQYMSFFTINGIERMWIDDGGNVGIGEWPTGKAKLVVDGPVRQRLDVIQCQGRDDWDAGWKSGRQDQAQDHPIMLYFKQKLSDRAVGTYLRGIVDHPSWRGVYWEGFVDAGGGIQIYNNNNDRRVIPLA